MLLPKISEAAVLVLATTVYVDGVSGPMKNLLDRILPLAHPFIMLRNGHCRHHSRIEHKGWKLVTVANSGFWEMDNFDPLLAHMKALCKNRGSEFARALLRPHGPALRGMMDMPVVFDSAKAAGRQLVENGKMSPETLKVVSRELLPLKM